ncbi:TetR family transcriptional regulator [Hyphomicrobium methylovorum]|uniref:TetR/AcrR family transcriptional regulator n=1 Tax=Hyphomicrobium methylovorum TaxID=84 RepID=UPI0015E703C7|nr:TetR/AcrR family transcriptional regulator [Hyphomicrobium methylovorum]MBA2125168.1 TetR family transcriptional regulator [Hyphomicrobium methylovorum]
MDTTEAQAAPATERRGGRPAAGTDPAKRRQILEGAGRMFSTLGFDGTSMSDVAREAQVSKATLYVYFQDKEHLFTAICAERRDRNISELITLLDPAQPVDATLRHFGRQMMVLLSTPFVIAAHRIVIGVAERMPEIGKEFFEAGPKRTAVALASFIDTHVEAGRLHVPDSYLAAAQFLELVQSLIFRPRLYGAITETPTEAEINTVVDSAVAMFLAAYGPAARG